MVKKWRNSEFLRSVSTLMTGTVVAQVVSYLMYPLITRIYSPEEMGELGFYLRWVGFIAAIASARYEVAIPIPKRDQHAYLLFRLALRISYVVLIACSLFTLIYYFLSPAKLSFLVFMFLALVSAYFTVWMNLGIHWSIRHKKFKSISSQRIVNSLSVNSLRWLFGVFHWGTIGLILATVIGSFLSILVFIRDFLRFKPDHKSYSKKNKLFVVAKTYRDFPRLNLPLNLIELGMDLFVAHLILLFFSKDIFGSYSYALLILKIPLSLVGQSIGQVFFNRCSEKINRHESILADVKRMAKNLFLLALLPFGILFFWGETIFGYVFGDQWFQSGKFAEILAVSLFVNFVLSPLSTIPIVLNRQREVFKIGIGLVAILFLSFGLIPFYLMKNGQILTELTFIWILSLYTLLNSAYLIFVYFVYLSFAKTGEK